VNAAMNRRNITIAIAAILALGVGLVVYGVLTAPHKAVPLPRNVVVAAMRIPAHARIVPEMLTVVQKPPDQVDPSALTDPSQALGQIAMADIAQASPILPADVAAPPTPAPEVLHVANGMRAVTIPIDQVKGVAGLLRPGDHVDVIAVPPRSTQPPEAFTIIRDSKVLAVGTEVANPPEPVPASPGAQPTPVPVVPTTATLQVTPAQADLLTSADINATLRLALRSPREPADTHPAQEIEYPMPPAPPAPASGPAAAPQGVPVINGDKVEVAQPNRTEPTYNLVITPPSPRP